MSRPLSVLARCVPALAILALTLAPAAAAPRGRRAAPRDPRVLRRRPAGHPRPSGRRASDRRQTRCCASSVTTPACAPGCGARRREATSASSRCWTSRRARASRPRLYSDVDEDDDGELDDLRFDADAQAFSNWQTFRGRARDVSRTLRPGLLAGIGARRRGVRRRRRAAPLRCRRSSRPTSAAASRTSHSGRPRRWRGRARALARSRRSGRRVGACRPGRPRAAGRAVARAGGQRAAGDRAAPRARRSAAASGSRPAGYLRQPASRSATAGRGSPRSGSTRRDGLVVAIDFAPTVLDWIGVEPPDQMRGRRSGPARR